MTEHDGAEPVDVEDEWVREVCEQLELGLGQLVGRPRGHGVRDLDVLTTTKRDELAISVATHQAHPIALGDQTVEDFARLRTRCVVAGDHDQFGGAHLGLVEHGLEDGKDTVNVREHRN